MWFVTSKRQLVLAAVTALLVVTGALALVVAGGSDSVSAGTRAMTVVPRTVVPETVIIPGKAAIASEAAAPTVQDVQRAYARVTRGQEASIRPASAVWSATRWVTVRDGDTLTAIAQRDCGRAADWTGIYAANRKVIGPDPNQIRAGQRLRLSCRVVTVRVQVTRHGGWGGGGSGAGYANPLRSISNLYVGRIDEGQDFTGYGPLYAIGPGTIEQVWGPWPNGVFIAEHMSDGRWVYYAESINPSVQVGEYVYDTTVIGQMYDSSTGIEIGWGTSTPSTAAAWYHYTDGVPTPEGYSMQAFLRSLGVGSGALAAYVPPSAAPAGNLGCSGLEQLWIAAGGAQSAAFMAAEIAMAESGGDQYALSPGGDKGYWQISLSNGSLSTYDAYGNARAAITLSGDGTNWSPWTTYTSGAYAGRC